MGIFLNISTLINSEGFGVNTDILETNVINIAILVVILVQFVGGALATSLATRKQTILASVNDAEKRLVEATNRVSEANIQLAQTKVAIEKIVQELKLTKINLIKTGADRIFQEMLIQIKASELSIALNEQKLLVQIKQQILTLAIKRVVIKLEQDLGVSQHRMIINQCLKRLGGLVNHE